MTCRDGSTRDRGDFLDILLPVRCFYLDLRDGAMDDPSRVPWVVPAPIRASDVAGSSKRQLRSRSRIHQRIRERTALMPEVVARLEMQRRDATELLRLATEAPVGHTFTHVGSTYTRVSGTIRSGRGMPAGRSFDVEVHESGQRVSAARVEDDAFWTWAMVETLRHTGLSIEELLELTHLALISYQLSSTGELVPLLQVVPSKTNEERLLLVIPELASVLATIISRLRTRHDGSVPLEMPVLRTPDSDDRTGVTELGPAQADHPAEQPDGCPSRRVAHELLPH